MFIINLKLPLADAFTVFVICKKIFLAAPETLAAGDAAGDASLPVVLINVKL